MGLTVDQFAQKIKDKHPEYQSLDNATLTQKVLTKYPQYQSQVDTSGMPSNSQGPTPAPSSPDNSGSGGLIDSASQFAGGAINSALNVGEGAYNLGASALSGAANIAEGGVKTILAGASGDNQGVQQGIEQFKQPLQQGAKFIGDQLQPIPDAIRELGHDAFNRPKNLQEMQDRSNKIMGGIEALATPVTAAVAPEFLPAVMGGVGAEQNLRQGIQQGESIAQALGEATGGGFANAALGKAFTKAPATAKSLPELPSAIKAAVTSPENDPAIAVQKIIQGSKTDVQPALRAFSEADISKATTHRELQDAVDKTISSKTGFGQQMTDHLSSDPTKYLFKDLPNPGIERAIQGLIDYNKAAGADADVARLTSFQEQGLTSGLDKNTMNDILKEYSTTLGPEARHPVTGKLMTDPASKNIENIRKDGKVVVRDLSPNIEFKKQSILLDKKMSDAINTRNLLKRQADAADTLSAKTLLESPAEKKANKAIKIAKTAGIYAGIGRYLAAPFGLEPLGMAAGAGLGALKEHLAPTGSLNVLQREALLPKFLKTIQDKNPYNFSSPKISTTPPLDIPSAQNTYTTPTNVSGTGISTPMPTPSMSPEGATTPLPEAGKTVSLEGKMQPPAPSKDVQKLNSFKQRLDLSTKAVAEREAIKTKEMAKRLALKKNRKIIK